MINDDNAIQVEGGCMIIRHICNIFLSVSCRLPKKGSHTLCFADGRAPVLLIVAALFRGCVVHLLFLLFVSHCLFNIFISYLLYFPQIFLIFSTYNPQLGVIPVVVFADGRASVLLIFVAI